VHGFAEKVFLEGSFAGCVVLEGDVAVGAESAGEDGDVPKDGFERFIEDVGHFVLEILSGDEGVEEVDSIVPFESYDFTTCSADVGVDVEGFPEMVD